MYDLIEAFEPTIEVDELSARAVLAATSVLMQRTAEPRLADLALPWVRAVIARGTLDQELGRAYGLGGQLLSATDTASVGEQLFETVAAAMSHEDRRRIVFLVPLIDLARNRGEYTQSRELLDRYEADTPEATLREHRLVILSLRAKHQIALGMPDLAVPILEELMREALRNEAEGRPFLDDLINAYRDRANARLATDRFDLLVDELRAAMADLERRDLAGRLSESDRAKLAAARPEMLSWLGQGLVEKSVLDAAHVPEARAALTEALELPEITGVTRVGCELYLAYLELIAGRLDEAASVARTLSERELDGLAADVRGMLHGIEARIARAGGADSDTLRRHRDLIVGDVEELRAAWMAEPARPGGAAFLYYSRPRFAIGELLSLTMELEPGEAGVVEALSILNDLGTSDSLARRLGAEPVPLQVVRRRLLSESTGALVYLTARDRSHVFAVDAEVVVHAALPGEWPLRELTNALRLEQLRLAARETGGAAAFVQRAAELGEALLPEPIGERVRAWDSVIVVGADLLGDPLFEALPFAGSSLGEARALSYLSSLALGVRLAERPGSASAERAVDVCLVGDVDAEGLEALPLRGAPADALASPFERVDTLFGSEASLARLADGRLADARVLQVFTHGRTDPERERSSGLLLADAAGHGTGVWCEDLEALDAPPLVVLAACGTARGPTRSGSGLAAHLGGAFLYGGASAVVLSEANLHYGPTLAFMTAFNAALAEGASVAEAAQQARVRLGEDARWEGALHGASIRVVGLGDGRPFPERRNESEPRLWLLAMAGLVAVGGLALLTRRASRRAS